jgi:iron(III) transport system ATP-binding protein
VEVMLSSFTGAITDFRVVTESGQEISVRSPSRNASKERYLFMHAPAAICRLLPRSGVVTRA